MKTVLHNSVRQDVSVKQHQDRLLNARNDVAFREPRSLEPEYGVKHEGDEVVIQLGVVPEFRLPKDAAIKLALLILKHAGVEVDRG